MEEGVYVAGTHVSDLLMAVELVRTPSTGGGRWLGSGRRGRNRSVDDLRGMPAEVGGWRWVAGDDGSGHVLEKGRR
jgi:hypothetical protein